MENSTTITTPDSTEIQTGGQGAIKMAEALIINSDDTYIAGAELRDHCLSKIKIGETLFEDSMQTAFRLHKHLVALFKAATTPWETAARIVKQKMIHYEMNQEQARRLEQQRLQAQAEAIAEQEQLEAIQLMREMGLDKQADYAASKPMQSQPVILPKATPDVGLTYRSNWTFTIEDQSLLPREFLIPDLKKIGGVVRALKDRCNIAGVKVIEQKV